MLADLIISAGLKPPLFVEPFAGGAAVSIALLEQGLVDRIALADRDPLVAGFWHVVFSRRAPDLADRIYDAKVTVCEWQRQRASSPTKPLDIAFKCLFLNRTSFSGALMSRTGPIGGARQKSQYTIDCRFNREVLAERVLELSRLSGRVDFVRCQSYRATFAQVAKRNHPGRERSFGISTLHFSKKPSGSTATPFPLLSTMTLKSGFMVCPASESLCTTTTLSPGRCIKVILALHSSTCSTPLGWTMAPG